MTPGIEPKADDTETLESEAVYCLNCDERLMGQFCYACGQKNTGPRLNGRILLHNLFEAITNVDSRLWRTLIDLFKNPGRVAKRYIGGERVHYLNPVQFFLATFAVYLAFLAAVDWLEVGGLEAVNVTFDNEPGEADTNDVMTDKLFASLEKIIVEQRDLFTFITLPIFAWLLRFLFRRDQYNFAETLSFVCFVFGTIQIYGFAIAIFQFGLGIPYNGSQGWVVFGILMQSIFGFYTMGWMRSGLMAAASFITLSFVQTAVGAVLAASHMFLFGA
ncbi:MAG: DUF3667 domain-containing protein [Kordiimonas sp.]